jgi:hypothetical protein
MRQFTRLAAAASLAAALSVGAADPTVGERIDRGIEKTKDTTADLADRTKDKARDAKANWSNGRIHTMLGQITNAALTKGGFDDLVERFNDADRNRLANFHADKNNKEKLDVLDGRIAQFQADWRAKYGQDFKVAKDDVVFGHSDFTVALGEIGKDAQLAGQPIPAADKVTADDAARQAKDNSGNTKLDRNIEKGRDVAYVTVAKSHGLPELKVPLIHELPDVWKIDVPDSVDGPKLYDNVLKHLTMANEQKDKWPSDVTDGYRMVAHHVLMAVLDVDHDAKAAAGARLGAETAKPVDK